jgi:hypothetical protein
MKLSFNISEFQGKSNKIKKVSPSPESAGFAYSGEGDRGGENFSRYRNMKSNQGFSLTLFHLRMVTPSG